VHVPELIPLGRGRRFEASRAVHLGDVLPTGEVRLDALAAYLQDIAGDDGGDAGIDRHLAWVVRKTTLAFVRRPVMTERLHLVTWASRTGGRWAERRTTISVAGEAAVEAAAVWVCVDVKTRRPAKLSPRFWEMYGEAVGERTVSSRLTHPDPPAEVAAQARPWPLRAADIDVLEHVNNAAVWAAVEDVLHRQGVAQRVAWAELEYRSAIEPDASLTVAVTPAEPAGGSGVAGGPVWVWLLASGTVQASAQVALT
jgi:acyl-ACP thioesterase